MQERPSLERPRAHCGQKPGAASGFSFAVLHVEEPPVKATFKTDPGLTILLRDQYASVLPARYFDKRYWSTLTCDGTVPEDEVTEPLDTSYDVVFESLRRSDKESLRDAR